MLRVIETDPHAAPIPMPGSARGVGYLLAEGGQPVRLKSYYLDDPTVADIARRAALLRRGHGHGPQRASEAA